MQIKVLLPLTNRWGTETEKRWWQTLLSYLQNWNRVSYWGLQERNLWQSSKSLKSPSWDWNSHPQGLSFTSKWKGTETTAHLLEMPMLWYTTAFILKTWNCYQEEICYWIERKNYVPMRSPAPSRTWRTLSFSPSFFYYHVIIAPWGLTAICSLISTLKTWSLD